MRFYNRLSSYWIQSILSILIIIGISGCQLVVGQVESKTYSGKLKQWFKLSKKAVETSGIIYYDNNIWTFNDSGGKPEIYRINSKTGDVIQVVSLKNGKNNDWEDITQDDHYIYAGDFGNNRGNRKDLTIYKIRKADISSQDDIEITAEIIEFSYNDQDSYEVRNRSNNFDCESVICVDDKLVIFSKNWENGKTRMYKMPKEAGAYKLNPIETFNADGLVTGADFYTDNKKLVLLGYKDRIPFLYIFPGFELDKINSGEIFRIDFPEMENTQTEGICFINKDKIAISAERTKDYKQSVYYTKLNKLTKLFK